MEIEKALEYAQEFKRAIVHDGNWGINRLGATVHENRIPKVIISSDFSEQFMLLLLNTFIEAQGSLSKSPNEGESLATEKLRKMLTAHVKEHRSHSFVQQWQEQHENDEKRLIDFGPTNNEPEDIPQDEKLRDAYKEIAKVRAHKLIQQWWNQLGFGPTNKESEVDSPEESEEDVAQIIINIGELNINLNGGV